ncbi:NADH-ubiquinone oxidoreductase 12 kDa subunit [Laetiporus sulphureus 93-53]|uniref:NADH-ubiquinone oxidoreductase 12 kDa subunit n=1 Tax=Laetiporus sulphureus 93-53 TaxID=1314785 RepID=A0A165ET12_9APHY|nr:NADH-ubiquinone oxidoreductase 12 kDa subunit [Laetiporus sulphureus 93-53]KZT07696.1 NADH-ubiquinone oxidoreductase 12 kDa subunit [Laetiporus sulphureus 93-53]
MPIDEARAEELNARLKEREMQIRESFIRAMEAKIMEDNIMKCHRIEGVNHQEKCKDLALRYAKMFKENRMKGYKHIDVMPASLS